MTARRRSHCIVLRFYLSLGDSLFGVLMVVSYCTVRGLTAAEQNIGAILKRVLIPLANGVEELEAVATIDVLRRAGCHVVSASVGCKNPIVGRNRIRLMADIDLLDAMTEWAHDWDLVVLPGGLGAVKVLGESDMLMEVIAQRLHEAKPIAAICAAPILLVQAGLEPQRTITCHPAAASHIKMHSPAQSLCADTVIVDRSVITSRGAGTAVEFALSCAELLCGASVMTSVAKQMALSS